MNYLCCMSNETFQFKGFTIEYRRMGKGKKPIIALHGFGRSLEDFSSFSQLLSDDEVLIAVNLFAHGQSQIPESRPVTDSITLEEYNTIFSAFLDHLNADRFDLIAYSMGGKIALVTTELFGDRIDRLTLMASDGFSKNRLTHFSTGTRLGRTIHKTVLRAPGILLYSTNVLRTLRLIDKKMHRFVHVHMGTEKSRKQVYAVWHIYRHFKPNLPLIADIINQKGIEFVMIFGKYDSVIKPQLGKYFSTLLKNKEALVVIESGHQLMADALTYLLLKKETDLQ